MKAFNHITWTTYTIALKPAAHGRSNFAFRLASLSRVGVRVLDGLVYLLLYAVISGGFAPLLWSSSVILVVTLGFVHIRAYLLRSGSRFSQVALAFGQLVHHIFHIRGHEEVSRTLKIVGIAIASGITGNLLSRTVGFPVAEKLFCHRLNCASLAIDGLCSVSERQPLVEGRVLEGVHAR